MQLPRKVEGTRVRSLSLVGVVEDQEPLSHCGTGGRCCKCTIHSLCCSVHHVFVGSLLEGSAQELSVFSVKITYNPGFLTYLAFCVMYFYVVWQSWRRHFFCPLRHPQVTLQYLWEKEYQVLVFYHHPMALEVPFLWPGQMMPSPWANTTDPEKLVQFLQASVTDRRSAAALILCQVRLNGAKSLHFHHVIGLINVFDASPSSNHHMRFGFYGIINVNKSTHGESL